MKNILIDLISLQANFVGKYNGGGEYAKIVFDRLFEFGKGINIFGLINSKYPTNEFVEHYLSEYNLKCFDLKTDDLNNILIENRINTFYSPLPYKFKNIDNLNCRFLGTIHGLRELEDIDPLTELFYTNSLIKKIKALVKLWFPSIKLKRKIPYYESLIKHSNFEFVTVSNHTKYAIASYLNLTDYQKIKVFYSPDTTSSPQFNIENEVSNTIKNLRDDSYFLLVSGNRWIKNNARAILALDEIFSQLNGFIDKKAIVTGITDLDSPYLKKIKNPNRFIFLNYVSNAELNYLYKNSFCFIYPSLNEGFGYPPLEAMKYGKPVLSSPYTSITEICGDAPLYFNPLSMKEIKNRILMILDDELYTEKSESSLIQFKKIQKKQAQDLEKLVSFIIDNDAQ